MARASKVARLPGAVREEIARLRNERHYTLDQIVAHLKTMGLAPEVEPSRSGLARHIQGLDKLAERVQRSRDIAEALVRKYGDAPENRTTRLNIELLHSTITDIMLALGEDDGEGHGVTLDARSVHDLSKALDHLSRASRADADLAARIKKELSAEQNARIDQTVADVGQTAKEAGLSADRIFELQSKVAGLRIDPARPIG